MNKKYLIIILVLISASASLAAFSLNYYDILNEKDIERQISDSEKGPTLSSGTYNSPQWESFNTWQCFSTSQIELNCLQIADMENTFVPDLQVLKNSRIYDFSLDPELELDCEENLNQWSALLQNEERFCTYAAYLQEVPEYIDLDQNITSAGLWIIEKLKTDKGYWNYHGMYWTNEP